MKIKMTIAVGYKRGELKRYLDGSNNPALEATRDWVEAKFGGWITTNLTEDFTIPVVTRNDFVIDFAHDTHAERFRMDIGGRVVDAA